MSLDFYIARLESRRFYRGFWFSGLEQNILEYVGGVGLCLGFSVLESKVISLMYSNH